MIVALTDTHSLIWYLSVDPRLSVAAKLFMDTTANQGDEIGVSAISLIEMGYMVEKGLIPAQQLTILAAELGDPSSMFVEIPVDLQIARTLSRLSASQLTDMPDRIIAATAVYYNLPLISRDGKIKLSSVKTIW